MAEPSESQVETLSSGTGVVVRDNERSHLNDLIAQATLKYSVKDYNAAAEFYSQATEIQAELNGEMSSQNADLLYAYGRCLYHVAVRNSDVLGSKVAGEKHEEGTKKSGNKKQKIGDRVDQVDDDKQRTDEEIVTAVVEKEGEVIDGPKQGEKESKPYFQFTGDENFDTDDEDEEDGAEGEGDDGPADGEDDDFVNAYEVLDLARVLLLKRLAEGDAGKGKGKVIEEAQLIKQLKERLADTYDLQAEISLEGERFPNAVVDLKAALALKEELFPQESSLIAEAHYKLSLALEFSSVTQQKTENGEAKREAHVDEAMRDEAANEMEAAIASCRSRIYQEEAKLGTKDSATQDGGRPKVSKEDVDDVKEMVKDMEQRLVELRQPPVSINDPTGTGSVDGTSPLNGILGSILGESPAAQKARIEEAAKGANDLTNLVKRKRPTYEVPKEPTNNGVAENNGKRKVEFADEIVDIGPGKKARVSEAG